MTPAQKAYQQKVLVPEQTITRVLNPPTTNTATSSYTVAGVDPSNRHDGPHHQGPARQGHLVHAPTPLTRCSSTPSTPPPRAEGRGDAHHQLQELQDRRARVADAHRQCRGHLLPALDDAVPRPRRRVM